jgi:hypothetical protein
MYGEDWIKLFRRIIRILKIKWWVYSKHRHGKKLQMDDGELKSIKPDYTSYVGQFESFVIDTDLWIDSINEV